MRRWIPSWPLALSVFVLWLMLQGDLSVAQLLLGGLLALTVPLLGEPLREQHAVLRRPSVALRLAGIVLWDIIISNIEVARLVVGPQHRIRPGFIWIPLDIRSEYGITALAGIITMTPGTVSIELTADRRHLLVHCLSLADADATIAQIKARYETPLMEIFR